MTDKPKLPPGAIRVPGTDRLFHRHLIMVPLLANLAITLMAISSINVALPSIESNLGAAPSDLQLLLSGYALAFGIVLVPAGRIGDVLGHSGVFVVGLLVFTLGSLGCAFAFTPGMLNAMRIAQGVGAGIASPQVNGMILRYFIGRHRARAFALFGLIISGAVAVAPALTGLFIDLFGASWGWRASFLWNIPIGLVTILLALRWLPFDAERARRLARERGEQVSTRVDLDPVGIVLLSLAVVCIMAPFMIKQPGWFSLLGVGALLTVAWVAWERRYAQAGRQPMVDLELFGFRSYTNGILVSGAQFLGGTSTFAVLALFLQNGLGVAALAVGLIGLPSALSSAWGSMWAGGRVLTSGRQLMVTSFVIYLFGLVGTMVLAQFLDPGGANLHYAWLAVPLALCGWGVGAVNSANQTLSQEDIPPKVGGTAGAVKQVAERIGTAIGNAMTTALLFSLAATNWTKGFTAALGLITGFVLMAMIFAIIDRRMLGDGRSGHLAVAP